MDAPVATWTRIRDPDDRRGIFAVEIAVLDRQVFVRSGREEKPPKVEIDLLASPASARKSADRRIAKLISWGWAVESTFDAPVPLETSADEKLKQLQSGKAAFVALLPGFFARWAALGHDPHATFHAESTRGRPPATPGRVRPWHTLAAECVKLASEHFGVTFALRLSNADGEHGFSGRVRPGEVGDFYECPARVARIAREKLKGRLHKTDGGFYDEYDGYGVRDEVDDALAALKSG